MFFHFQVLLQTIVFWVGMEMFSYFSPAADNWVYNLLGWLQEEIVKFFIVSPLSLVLMGVAFLGARKIGGRIKFAIGPAIFAFSAANLLYFIDSKNEKQIFILLSTLIYYFYILGLQRLKAYRKDQTAKGLVIASSTAAIFFSFTSAYGVYLNYNVPMWSLMAFFMLATFAVAYQCLSIIAEKNKLILSYSVILGLVMTEFAWVVNFWPFGYLTSGVVALIFYYIFWDLTHGYFMNILSKKRVIANLILFTGLLILVLVSSKWLPDV